MVAVMRRERRGAHRLTATGAATGVLLTLAACGSVTGPGSSRSSPWPAAPATAAPPLRVLVTNDDGVRAPGIDAVVQALRSLPGTEVTVVAPATNQSGSGGRTTDGPLTVAQAATASGYPAWAVNGYPADTVVWAIDDRGISFRPDLVVAGVNNGVNLGPLAAISGTVGAARAALERGIPALAASQGADDDLAPDYPTGASEVRTWVQSHRSSLVDRTYGASPPAGNLNVPTCPAGRVRGPVPAPLATTFAGTDVTTVDCSSTSTSYSDDAHAYVLGYAVIAPL